MIRLYWLIASLLFVFILPIVLAGVLLGHSLKEDILIFEGETGKTFNILALDIERGIQAFLLRDTTPYSAPAWSTDGTSIQFYAGPNGERRPYRMSPAGRQIRAIEDYPDLGTEYDLSPDGRYLLYVSALELNNEIFIRDNQTGETRNLTRHPADDRSPVWSPDGSTIAFSTNRDGNWEIFVMDAEGNGAWNLTQHPYEDIQPRWSPDGTKIAFTSWQSRNPEVHVMNANGAYVRNITQHNGSDNSPAWSPDGTKIAFNSTRTGDTDIYVLDLATNELHNISNRLGFDSVPSWRP